MAAKSKPKQGIDLKELLMTNVIQTEALINLLEKKGALTREELFEEMMQAHASLMEGQG